MHAEADLLARKERLKAQSEKNKTAPKISTPADKPNRQERLDVRAEETNSVKQAIAPDKPEVNTEEQAPVNSDWKTRQDLERQRKLEQIRKHRQKAEE